MSSEIIEKNVVPLVELAVRKYAKKFTGSWTFDFSEGVLRVWEKKEKGRIAKIKS